MISAHLPALQVVIPLLAAPLSLFLRRPVWSWAFTLLICLTSLAVSIQLLQQVLDSGVISYAMGDWEPPWGIEYRIDLVNSFVLLIVSIISSVVMLFAGKSLAAEVVEQKRPLFYTAYLLCLAGLYGIAATGDAFNLFVFLEISSLSTYILISLGQDRRSLTAAFQYLIMGTIGATFILIGVGMLYMMTGTLNMYDLSQRLPEVMDTRTVRSGFAFLTVGISLKLALFPLHLWLPNAYTYAPSVASAFLAATATKVAVYALLRFLFTVFGVEFSFRTMPLDVIFLLLATLAIFIGSGVAIYQDNIKRMLAYSSVAQIGYMILGISFASATGLTAAILHLFNHAMMKGGLFLALGAVYYRLGSVRLDTFRGLGQTMPWTMMAIVIGGLSLIGVPLTVGFISKWYLVLAALEQGWWPVAVIVLAGSLLAIIYIWRLVEMAYFQEPPAGARREEAPLSLLTPVWLLIAANVYFGINTDLTVGVAGLAADQLLGGLVMTGLEANTLMPVIMVLPLIAAVLIRVIGERNPNLREAVTLVTAVILFLLLLELLPAVLDGARPTFSIAEPFPGIPLQLTLEPVGMLFALIAGFLWIITSIYAIGYMRGHHEENQTRFYICFALAISVTMGVAFAGNLLTLFVFYEMLTLSTYPLVTHAGTDAARRAGRVYLGILLTTSIVLLLLAIIWTWSVAGTLEFRPGGILGDSTASATVLGALVLLYFFGVGKAALMPFHRWLPAAMVAPTPVSALLHAVAVVKAGVFSLLKISLYIFGADFLHDLPVTQWLSYFVAASILLASLVAMTKDNLKARLAYSTVSQLGYISLGALMATTGVLGGAMHIVMHAFAKITLFFGAGAIMVAAHKTEISQLDGLGRRMPLTFTAFTIGSLSIIGLPPLGGMWSKWYLALATLETGEWLLLAALLLSSLLNIYYLLSIPARAFFVNPGQNSGEGVQEAPLPCLIAMTITSLACLWLFFFPQTWYQLAALAVF